MKTCFKCLVEKPLHEFYRHSQMGDGHLNKCKSCTKRDAKEYRTENLESILEYDRSRGQLPHRKRLTVSSYRKRTATKAGRKREWEKKREWLSKNREKRAVHIITDNAITAGRLVRKPCERCGKKKVDAHHEDYGKPLEVNWLCRKHHGERHREINAARRAKEKKK